MPWLRIFAHLLPDSSAWRLTVGKTLRKFFDGLTVLPEDVRTFVDGVYLELFPASTNVSNLPEWETQFGLLEAPNTAARRVAIDAAWKAQGGQDPRYLQDLVQAAGFSLYIHEWWEPGSPPWIARNPRDYTEDPLIGTYQCAPLGDPLFDIPNDEPPLCTGYDENGAQLDGQPQCDNFLVNEPGYLVNRDLTLRPPPPIPTDPASWPNFIYWGGETFPDRVSIDDSRRAELERLVLKHCPAQNWLVMLVDYDPGVGIFDDSFDHSFN